MRAKLNPRVIAVTGAPGAGKTTLAKELALRLYRTYVSTGDIARIIDPEAIARGEMADRNRLHWALKDAVEAAERYPRSGVVVDGAPREPADLEYLGDDVMVLLLTCRTDVALDRQMRRGRPGDEDAMLVLRRTHEQERLLELDVHDGWAFKAAGHGRAVQTTYKPPEMILQHVLEYLDGQRGEIY